MKVGVALPHYDQPGAPADMQRVVDVSRECERLGFDSVWVSDHLVFDLAKYGGSADPIGCLEPLTTLAVLARETSRVRLGTMVLCNELRHPALVAKAAASIDLASAGRLELGIGAGWYERDFLPFGISMPRPGVRLARLAESVEVLKGLLSGRPFSWSGRHYRIDDAVMMPPPAQRPRPAIWVGGKGDRAVALAGRVGDGWNAAWFSDPAAYKDRIRRLGGSKVRRSIGQYAQGSAQEMVDRLQAFAALGVEHAVMCFGTVPFALDDPDDVARFASDVLPHVRGA
ncbi:MAG TPA: LLM class flavin-dependent oxidoreductase [Actinomycetota bacterium]|nr:LLM class flavin-dependent oxidoreductase [Actinomycetota bacterium]